MKRVEELQESLSEVFDKVVAGTIEPKTAKELTNIAGKMISSATLQLKYKIATKKDTAIKFLETEGE